MKFKYNLFNLITAIVFVLSFLSLMISYATSFMYYVALVLFMAGFVMLSIVFMKSYLKQRVEDENASDEIIMRLSGGIDGEAYVMADEKQNKKERAKNRTRHFDKLLPFIFCVVIVGLFMFMFIRALIIK